MSRGGAEMDVSKVTRGEQYRPVNESPKVSTPPSLKSTDPVTPNRGPHDTDTSTLARHCYASYLDYHLCAKHKGSDCHKFESNYKSLCPKDWIERWDKERVAGKFAGLPK